MSKEKEEIKQTLRDSLTGRLETDPSKLNKSEETIKKLNEVKDGKQ